MDRDQRHSEAGDRNSVIQPGESLGNFRVTKCLSAGLLANYYQAQHIRDLHEVTIAVLHQRVKADPDLMKRLDLLRNKVRLIDHEGVPKIHDQTEINGQICLFLDPVKGQSLNQYMEPRGGLGEGLGTEETTRILAQLLGLVGYMHSKGVDHRDIDSDLVCIREDGSVCLLGAGLKAALGVHLFEQVVSASVCPIAGEQPTEHLSSFDVMSPEYQSGIEEDHRVDLYCVGVLGYWLLTGQKPDRSHYRAPSELNGELPTFWGAFFEKMLQRDRDQRFQSCRAALLALQDSGDTPAKEEASIQNQIDRIPVPRGVRARGKQATRIYRLTLIGLVGVPLVALVAQFMLSVLIEEKVPVEAVPQRVAGDENPQLELSVSPAAAKVEFAGFEKSFILQSGRLALSLAPGEYQLRVSAPKHIGEKKKIVINEDRDFTRKVAFELAEDRLRLSLRTEPFASLFLVDPEAGEIELGQAGAEGRFEFDRVSPPDDFRIVARKSGYKPAGLDAAGIAELRAAEGENGDDSPALDLPLVALPATVQFASAPAGARIRLDDEVIGLSPLTLVELEPRGEARVTAELEGFRSREKQIELKPGANQLVDMGRLVPRSGEIQVELRFEGADPDTTGQLREQTRIRVGEETYPLRSGAIPSIPEGRHVVRAEHPLYVSESQEVTLSDGQAEAIRFELQARPGIVRLTVPDGLSPEVRADGRPLEIREGEVRIPAHTPVKLAVRIRDHLTLVRELNLAPTELIHWEIHPVRIQPPQKGQGWMVPYLGIRIAWVPPGDFEMGSPLPEQGRVPNEGPRTPVTFTQGFWAGVYELTQAQYEGVMGTNPSTYVGSKRPVESLSWDQAEAFCARLTDIEREAGRLPEGYVYRLPTEAEWAYAGRAGTATPFHFGERADATKGNFLGVYPRDFEDGVRQRDRFGTRPVGQYPANALGLHDVHGNVREWTKDAYAARLPGDRLTDPAPRVGRERYTVRGGGWSDLADRVRSAAREDVGGGTASDSLGLRVFLAPAP